MTLREIACGLHTSASAFRSCISMADTVIVNTRPIKKISTASPFSLLRWLNIVSSIWFGLLLTSKYRIAYITGDCNATMASSTP